MPRSARPLNAGETALLLRFRELLAQYDIHPTTSVDIQMGLALGELIREQVKATAHGRQENSEKISETAEAP